MMFEDALFVIPARGGSKGIPGKNIKHLGGKPLIHYSLEFARQFTSDEHICLSTDDPAITACARKIGYQAKFVRPAHLATDQADTYGVLIHALIEYDPLRSKYKKLILLQPTSPFREKVHLENAAVLFDPSVDMVTSVVESNANPYYTLFEENEFGFLKISKGDGQFLRRQDAPKVYLLNGSIYIINVASIYSYNSIGEFKQVKKSEMPREYSIDLDTPYDWELAEFMLSHQK